VPHVGVVVAELLQLGFATVFLGDVNRTHCIHDAFSDHRVTLTARNLGCASVGRLGRTGLVLRTDLPRGGHQGGQVTA
jgi:hypothetical protein